MNYELKSNNNSSTLCSSIETNVNTNSDESQSIKNIFTSFTVI